MTSIELSFVSPDTHDRTRPKATDARQTKGLKAELTLVREHFKPKDNEADGAFGRTRTRPKASDARQTKAEATERASARDRDESKDNPGSPRGLPRGVERRRWGFRSRSSRCEVAGRRPDT